MKTDLAGMFANIVRTIRSGKKEQADYYAFCLAELKKHIEETIRGEHSLQEFADHYCLKVTGVSDA